MAKKRKTSSVGDIREVDFKDSLNYSDVSQDMEFTEFEKFIMYGIERTASTDDLFKYGIIVILLSIPAIVIEAIGEGYVFCVLFLLPTVVYLISTCKLQQGGIIEGPRYILYTGIWSGCFSAVCALIGVDLFFHEFNGKERIVFLLIAIGSYIIVMALYGYMYKWTIRKKAYSNPRKKATIITPTVGAVLGVSLSRTLNRNLEGKAVWLVPYVFLLISYLASAGVFNIYRFLYIVKHPKILDKYNEASAAAEKGKTEQN